jgi:hypothetical protein
MKWADFVFPPINLWCYPKQYEDYKMQNEETTVKPVWKVKESAKPDPVNNPAHYTQGNIEVIDYIEAKGLDKSYNLGNVIKYVSRSAFKLNKLEDLKKAAWYLAREIQNLEKE